MRLSTSILIAGILLTTGATIFGQQTTEAILLTKSEFQLPQEAIDAGIDGTVMVNAKVNENGKVVSARAYAGPEWPCDSEPKKQIAMVRKLAEEEVKSFAFEPATKKGKPVSSEVAVTFWVGRAYEERQKRLLAQNGGQGMLRVIKGGVVNGKALSLPKPDYPRNVRGSGAVTVSILIDENGKVIKAGARNGSPLVQGVSREAACKAKFSPTVIDGKPVKVSGVLTYAFVGPRP